MSQKPDFFELNKPLVTTPVVIALGNFDGIHRGHQVLLQKAQDLANYFGGDCRPMVVSFDPHPAALLNPPHYNLMTLEQKKARLNELGLTDIWMIPFTAAFAKLTAEDFIEQILLKNLNIKGVIVGFNFRFGYQRKGDIELLKKQLSSKGVVLEVVAPIYQASETDQLISTTRIKQALKEGHIEKVNQWLGSPYVLSGLVVKGQGRGHKIGVPTINLNQTLTLLPKEGVYYTLMRRVIDPTKWFQSVTNIGSQPTFDQLEVRIESHILNFNQMIYGEQVELRVLQWIRGVKKFSSIQNLTAQIEQDILSVQSQVTQW